MSEFNPLVILRDQKDEGERDECGNEEEPEPQARALQLTGHLVEELEEGGEGKECWTGHRVSSQRSRRDSV